MIPYQLIARYLAGECNEDEKKRIDEWSREHPETMEEYRKIWQEMPENQFNPDVEQALLKVEKRIKERKKKRSENIVAIIGAAAAVLTLLVNVFGLRVGGSRDDVNEHLLSVLETGVNQTTSHTLADGSTVWLNQSSTLRYPGKFDEKTREVYLEGEAFFEVTPDPDKPFIIHANHTITRVVGTSFGIRAVKDRDEVVVTVATGKVNFSAEGTHKPIELSQGEQAVCMPKEKILEKNEMPDPNLLAWKTKVLVFKQTPLAEVAEIIENTYHTYIGVDTAIAGMKLTSTFEQQNLEDIIEIIEMTLQIKADQRADGIYLLADE